MIHVDAELDRIATDLGTAGVRATSRVVDVTRKGAVNIRDDARDMIDGLAHAPQYPASITFSMDFTGGVVAADIGPDKDLPQGALGNLLEYGSVNNPPHQHLGPALDREGPDYIDYLEDAILPW